MEKKKERGITLIALIITIIVLLILAGVSITMLTGENGILKIAKEVKGKTNEESVKEKISIGIIAIKTKAIPKNYIVTLNDLTNEQSEYALEKEVEIEWLDKESNPVLAKKDDIYICIYDDLHFELSETSETYKIILNLDNCTVTNKNTRIFKESEYKTEIIAKELHEIENVTILLGETDVTSSSYNKETKTVNIDKLTDNLTITVSTKKKLNSIDVLLNMIDKNKEEYSTIDEIINDTEILNEILNNKDALYYVIESDRIMEAVLKSQTAIIELSKSDYASYQVYQKENLWNTLKQSKFFEEFNENRLISPILTSETSSPRVTVEGNYSEMMVTGSWAAFSEDKHTSQYGWGWIPAASDESPKDRYCRINFVDGSYIIYGYSLKTYMNADYSVDSSIDIIGKVNEEWKSLKENININYKKSDTIYSDIIDSKTEVTGLGIKIVSPNVIRRRSYCGYTSNVKFYGFKIK